MGINKKGNTIKDLAYKILIFIGAVLLIAYFLPRDDKFNYQFELNKPWKYGQLIATFDFPIYKDKAIIKAERDSIIKYHFQPYYQRDTEAEQKALNDFKVDYQDKFKKHLPSDRYFSYVNSKLIDIYNIGVITSDELHRLSESNVKQVMIAENKMAIERKVSNLYTVKAAYESFFKNMPKDIDLKYLRACDLNNYIQPSLTFEEERTQTAKEELLNDLSVTRGAVLGGQKIVDRGEIVDQRIYNILESLKYESEKRNDSTTKNQMALVGQILLISILMGSFMLFIELFRKDYYLHKRSLTLLFVLIIFFCILTCFAVDNFFNVYMIPFAMLPLIISIFLDSRTAVVAHTVTILICSITVSYPHEFIILQLVVGMVTIYSLRELSQRSQLLRCAFIITVTYVLTYLSLELMSEVDVSKFNTQMYGYFAVNGIFLLFTYPLLFVLEKTFGFTSNVTLVELSNVNNSLLRKLSEVAPGTFQHSMQMANLAAEAALHIGANSQLVRTGALYHDIGKSENPAFFTENQSGGINPHDKLSYEESAEIVINHVYDGIKLADKHNIPKAVKDFIVTHHGKGKTKYFYISWMNEHPDEKPDEEKFSYPGPNPFSKETAILMMADSVEAASRSLPEYTEETISNLVEKIIDSQVNEGYFKDCPITFQDIRTVKEVFKEKLKIIYHTRVSYPELKKK